MAKRTCSFNFVLFVLFVDDCFFQVYSTSSSFTRISVPPVGWTG